MDETERLMPDYRPEDEYEALESMMMACMEFEIKWRVKLPWRSDAQPDAVIAVHELHKVIVARRRFLLARLVQQDLPF